MAGMKTILPFAACVAACLTASCGPSFRFEGTWIGFRDYKARPGENPEILRTLSKIELTIKPNGQFELIEAGIPFEGPWREFGGKAFLKIQSVMRRPIEESGYSKLGEKEIEVTSLENGTVDYFDPGGYDGKPINLKRQSKP